MSRRRSLSIVNSAMKSASTAMLDRECGSRSKPPIGDGGFLGEGLAELGDARGIAVEGGGAGVVELFADGVFVHLGEREQDVVLTPVVCCGERVSGVGAASAVGMGPRLRGDDGLTRGRRSNAGTTELCRDDRVARDDGIDGLTAR